MEAHLARFRAPNLLTIILGLLFAAQAGAQGVPREVFIPNSKQIRFTSKINHFDYVISITLSNNPPPPSGYPVLYLLDPYWMLGTATESARMNRPDVVIVGIGSPVDDEDYLRGAARLLGNVRTPDLDGISLRDRAIFALRTRDLSLKASTATWATGGYPPLAASASQLSGGLDAFLDVIDFEVKPRVAKLFPIDVNNEAIFGHSLGGLATLHAYLTRPASYDTFIAASPSIWAGPQLWAEQERFKDHFMKGAMKLPRLLITVGEKEQNLGSGSKMLDNARTMASRLQKMSFEGKRLRVARVIFAGEDHGSVQQASITRAITFSFPKPLW